MTGQVGPRGLSVLIFVGILALALAVVGWFQRDGATVGPPPQYSSQTAFYPIGGGITG
jgi:hypothetical protein